MKKKIPVRSKRKIYWYGKNPYKPPIYVYFNLIMSKIRYYFFKPIVDIQLVIKKGSTEYSESFLRLDIKTLKKEIGHFAININAKLYQNDTRELIFTPVLFEETPEVLEASDSMLLKSKTNINLLNVINEKTTFNVLVTYHYMYLGKVRMVSHSSTWLFKSTNTQHPSLKQKVNYIRTH